MLIANKVISGLLDGVNTLFYGNRKLLKKITWIENDSQAIYEDWKKVGLDIVDATNKVIENNNDKKVKTKEIQKVSE